MRYGNHFQSIKFAVKKKAAIQEQIKTFVENYPTCGGQDLQFLEEVADLVIKARRALAYTYPIRFFLKGRNKQAFFDFI